MSVIAYFRIGRDRARAILAELESFAEAFEHTERQAVRRVLKRG